MSVILLYNSVIKSSNVVQSAEFFSTLGLKSVSSPFLVPFFGIHVLYLWFDRHCRNLIIIEQTLQEFDFFELIGVCFKYILIFLVGNR